jgi:hypothetical protein
MGLRASLSDFSASQIFFLLAKFNKTGRVELRTTEEKGEVFFVKGNVTHAKCSKTTGVEALYNLSVFNSGEIEFFTDEKSPEVTIKDEVSSLIGEIERRKVELNEITAKLPPFDTILIKSPNPPKDSVALRKDDWRILVLMDGKNSVKQAVEKSGLGALTVYKTIAWLLEKGLVFDPKEMERTLKERVAFLNTLIKELATLGISEKDWIHNVKTIIESTDSGARVLDILVTGGTVLSLKAKKNYDVSKEEIEAVFAKVVKSLDEKCKSEFGPMLAKTKLATAEKKHNEAKR